MNSSIANMGASELAQVLVTAQGLAVISPLAICVAFFSIVGTLTIGISVLPQTIDTIKNQQTQTFSWLMYVFLVVGCFFLMIYGIGLVEAGGAIEGTYYSYDTKAAFDSTELGKAPLYERANINYIYFAVQEWLKEKGTNGETNAAILAGWSNPQDLTASTILALVLSDKANVTNDISLALPATLSHFNASELLGKAGIKDNSEVLVVTPSTYRNYQVNYTTPGGLLIIGEGFASLTSAIVLWYKVKNMMMAKKEGISEAEYCTKLLEEIKAKKGAKK